MKKSIHIILSVFILIFLLSTISIAETTNETENLNQLHQKAIFLVLESSPVIISQKDLIQEYEDLEIYEGKEISFDIDGGIAAEYDDGFKPVPRMGFNFSYPLFSPDREIEIQRQKITYRETLTTNIHKLENLKNEKIKNLTQQINQLTELIHQIKGKNDLLETLNQRKRRLEELVNAGIVDPENLWNLDERISELKIELNSLNTQKTYLINEIALSYAGEQWEDLKIILNEIVNYIKVGDNNG